MSVIMEATPADFNLDKLRVRLRKIKLVKDKKTGNDIYYPIKKVRDLHVW